MLEKDLETLRNVDVAPPLKGLEPRIWHKVAADREATRMQRIVLTCQASAVAVVIVGGLALGNMAPRDTAASPGFDAFSLRSVPAPSTLLLGSHS